MIAIESIKRYHLIDVIIILVFAGIFTALDYLYQHSLNSQLNYILTILTAIFLLGLVVHLIRKAGSATLFFILIGLFSWSSTTLGISGTKRLLALLIAGVIFEVGFLIFKLEAVNMQLDVIISSSIATASIPLSITLLFSPIIATKNLPGLLLFSITGLFLGLIATVVSFLAWRYLRKLQLIQRYEQHH